jgi:hypothetical protein
VSYDLFGDIFIAIINPNYKGTQMGFNEKVLSVSLSSGNDRMVDLIAQNTVT